MESVHAPRTLPVVLSRDEVARLIAAARNLKHATALSAACAASRRARAVAGLKLSDIDSQRMTLRVEQRKERNDRYAMPAPAARRAVAHLVASGPRGWKRLRALTRGGVVLRRSLTTISKRPIVLIYCFSSPLQRTAFPGAPLCTIHYASSAFSVGSP